MDTYSTDEIRTAYTSAAACRVLGISPSTLYRARHAGQIGFVRVGGRFRYPKRAVQAYANTARRDPDRG